MVPYLDFIGPTSSYFSLNKTTLIFPTVKRNITPKSMKELKGPYQFLGLEVLLWLQAYITLAHSMFS